MFGTAIGAVVEDRVVALEDLVASHAALVAEQSETIQSLAATIYEPMSGRCRDCALPLFGVN